MSFNEGAKLDTGQVVSGGRGRAGGVAVGGGLGAVVIALLVMFLGGGGSGGISVEEMLGQLQTEPVAAGDVDLDECRTGADANANDVCRIVGTVNSAQAYWTEALPRDVQRQYREATTVIFSGSAPSACGTASAATGPFYCPADERIYIDAGFFDDLTHRFGADGGNLAQMYVVAHEYGHHIQHILGLLGHAQRDRQGPESGAVRVELMADCLAGVWAHHAASTTDASGTRLIEPLTESDIASALSAAEAVGDDRIQASVGGRVNPEAWTHGSSEQRQRWFLTGYRAGSITACDTLNTTRL